MKRVVLISALALTVFPLAAERAGAMGEPRIAALQIGLHARGLYGATIDGLWGPATASAVRRLQRHAGISVNGIPGPRTRRALGGYGRPAVGRRVIRVGQLGWDVSVTQFQLAWHGFPSGSLDGAFGPRTEAAVRRFQGWARLGVDGVPGPATYAALARPLPRSPISLAWPLSLRPSDGFGPRGDRFHTGLDFPAPYGARVRAAGGGRVVQAGWDSGGYGNLVVVRHRSWTFSWYAHLATIAVRRGQRIVAGTRIGTVGATGSATGPHLHFEVRVRGAAVDPLTALR
ncbi:MAG: peptidoglycan DD-metalloendopeptidase family protein [Actinomycetota bacterium]|nr:peptidoglycan DD-metalloendopeptidase family protein [Actinomycetota bacterium]